MKITKEDLTFQIANALRDEFVATVTESEGVVTLAFVNGQKFSLRVEEEA